MPALTGFVVSQVINPCSNNERNKGSNAGTYAAVLG